MAISSKSNHRVTMSHPTKYNLLEDELYLWCRIPLSKGPVHHIARDVLIHGYWPGGTSRKRIPEEEAGITYALPSSSLPSQGKILSPVKEKIFTKELKDLTSDILAHDDESSLGQESQETRPPEETRSPMLQTLEKSLPQAFIPRESTHDLQEPEEMPSSEEEFATEYDSSEDSDLYSTQQETIPDEPTSDIEAKLEGAKDHVSQITNILEEIEELPGLQDVPVSSKEEQKQHSELRTYEMNNYIESETIPLVAEDEEELPGLQDVPSSHEEDDAISDELAVGIEEQEELEESPSLDAMSISHEEEPPPVVMDLMKTSQSISTIEKTDNIYTLGNLQNLRDIYSSPELKEEHFQPLLEMTHKKFCADASTFLLWDELNSSYRVLLHNGLDAHTLKNLYFGFFDLFLDQNLPSQFWNLNTMRSNIFFAKRFSREFLQEKHVAHILNLARENSKHSVFLFLFYSHIPKQDMKNLMNEFFELFQDYLPALYRFRKSQWSDRTEEHYLEDMLCQTSRLIKELSSGGKDTVSVLHLKLKGLGQYSDKEHQSKIDSIIQELSRLLNQEEKCILNHTEGMIFLLKVCNPSYFIQQAHKLSSSEGLSVQTVLKHYPQDGKNIHNYLNADS